MNLKLAILVLLAARMMCTSAVAAEYWVSPAGDDHNPGTADKPWKSIARVNIELNPWQSVWQSKAMITGGDTIIFADGEYEGCIEPLAWGQRTRQLRCAQRIRSALCLLEGLHGTAKISASA